MLPPFSISNMLDLNRGKKLSSSEYVGIVYRQLATEPLNFKWNYSLFPKSSNMILPVLFLSESSNIQSFFLLTIFFELWDVSSSNHNMTKTHSRHEQSLFFFFPKPVKKIILFW